MGARFLVMGCGGIGGVVAGTLVEAGEDVTAVTTNRAIAEAVEARGFRLRGEGGVRDVRGRVHVGVPEATYDYVLLATQPPQVEEAARTALPALAAGGKMVCFQNGLCEARVAAIAGAERTLGAVVAWGASMPEPGVYERTSAGGFTLGRIDSPATAEDDAALARALEAIGPVDVTANLAGKRWSKLAINCAITSCGAIGGERLGALLQHRFVRRMALEIMSETAHVARREGVKLEKVSGTLDLDWLALTDGERAASGSPSLVAKHALLLAVGFRFRRLRSSMLAAIERGRAPAVDFLNGEVIARGRRHGVPTPINEAVADAVWRIARASRLTPRGADDAPSLEHLRAVAKRAGID